MSVLTLFSRFFNVYRIFCFGFKISNTSIIVGHDLMSFWGVVRLTSEHLKGLISNSFRTSLMKFQVSPGITYYGNFSVALNLIQSNIKTLQFIIIIHLDVLQKSKIHVVVNFLVIILYSRNKDIINGFVINFKMYQNIIT